MSAVDLALFDDHPLLLDGLSTLLSECREFTVVGTGGSASDALRVSTSRNVDVAILDLGMPGDVFGAIQSLRARSPDTKILVFTASTAFEHAMMALEAGAHGYILKGSTFDELTDAIRAVVEGDAYLTQRVAAREIPAPGHTPAQAAVPQGRPLTAREEQVARLLLQGKSTREIADGLGMRTKTVRHYMSVLMQKLNAGAGNEGFLAAQRLQGESPRGLGASNRKLH